MGPGDLKKSIQMLKQNGLYVNIITTEYMSHVNLILFVPCLNIYIYTLFMC
jgi:biotin operon repressor